MKSRGPFLYIIEYIKSELIPRRECVWIFYQRHHLLMPAAAVHGEVRMYIASLVLDATEVLGRQRVP